MVPNVVRSISMACPPHDLGTRPRLRVGRRAWHRCQGTPASRRSPDSQTAPPRVGQLRRRQAKTLLAPRPIPSGIGMTKPTIHQARDRAGVVSGATRPEWVTSAGSLERLLTGARKRARDDGERRWNIMSNWTFVEADITRLMPGTKICSGNV